MQCVTVGVNARKISKSRPLRFIQIQIKISLIPRRSIQISVYPTAIWKGKTSDRVLIIYRNNYIERLHTQKTIYPLFIELYPWRIYRRSRAVPWLGHKEWVIDDIVSASITNSLLLPFFIPRSWFFYFWPVFY